MNKIYLNGSLFVDVVTKGLKGVDSDVKLVVDLFVGVVVGLFVGAGFLEVGTEHGSIVGSSIGPYVVPLVGSSCSFFVEPLVGFFSVVSGPRAMAFVASSLYSRVWDDGVRLLLRPP